MMDIYTALLYWGVSAGVGLLTGLSLLFAFLYDEAQLKMYNRWLTETGQHDKYQKWRADQQLIFFWTTRGKMKK
jgi:hypothetical protein